METGSVLSFLIARTRKHRILELLLMAYSDRAYVGTGPGPGPEWPTVHYVKPSHFQLLWELEQVLYFGIVSVPVLVPFPHKFCLNKPLYVV